MSQRAASAMSSGRLARCFSSSATRVSSFSPYGLLVPAPNMRAPLSSFRNGRTRSRKPETGLPSSMCWTRHGQPFGRAPSSSSLRIEPPPQPMVRIAATRQPPLPSGVRIGEPAEPREAAGVPQRELDLAPEFAIRVIHQVRDAGDRRTADAAGRQRLLALQQRLGGDALERQRDVALGAGAQALLELQQRPVLVVVLPFGLALAGGIILLGELILAPGHRDRLGGIQDLGQLGDV